MAAAGNRIATPLHVQRLERALDLSGLIQQIQTSAKQLEGIAEDWDPVGDLLSSSLTEHCDTLASATEQSDTESSDTDSSPRERSWLDDADLSSGRRRLATQLLVTSSDESDYDDDGRPVNELDLMRMLQEHKNRRKLARQYRNGPMSGGDMYYAAGLLSVHDRYRPDLAHSTLAGFEDDNAQSLMSLENSSNFDLTVAGSSSGSVRKALMSRSAAAVDRRGKKARKQDKDIIKVLTNQRRKLWLYICKKEIGKVQRSMVNGRKDKQVILKRLATGCTRVCRQRAAQSQKTEKEILWRMKRLTRDMQAYWKHYSRVEKETRKRLEKEEIEQRRISTEILEAKRQQRKLNFLLTQTELYAHFMGRKLQGAATDEAAILQQLDEGATDERIAALDDYNIEAAKSEAVQNARTAVTRSQQHASTFDLSTGHELELNRAEVATDYPQPKLFQGTLKSYQLKGMNWIANLFDSGINGILADEMGLGKTVQSLAFLAHLAEHYGIWGPFLVVSPASTLHNWQQELARFVPAFKVVPYWGTTQERKVLRTFWEQENLHTREASFHVVVTSYQLVVADIKYFSRIAWQCMVLDEAQALKSTSSQRWKNLLGFKCRNRILLTGTPIQNSMAELWALLHFIMPSLFDSHREFNEWFSKDIESHAENRTAIDEKHLSRLHLILKPFMLRRIKRDVENELTDKIEIMVYCPLTIRQRLLYQGLKKKISIDELLKSAQGGAQHSQVTTSLLNLVMQFRKVCNHPELFERRDVYSPLTYQPEPYILPKLLYRDGLLHRSTADRLHLLENQLNVFSEDNIHRSVTTDSETLTDGSVRRDSAFSFLRFVDHSPGELAALVRSLLARWLLLLAAAEAARRRRSRRIWDEPGARLGRAGLLIGRRTDSLTDDGTISNLLFTSYTSRVYTHTTHRLHGRPESLDHRLLRTRKTLSLHQQQQTTGGEEETATTEEGDSSAPVTPPDLVPGVVPVETRGAKAHTMEQKVSLLPEFPHRQLEVQVLPDQPTELPSFLLQTPCKAIALPPELYCSDRSAAWWWTDHLRCGSQQTLETLLHGSAEAAEDARSRRWRLSAAEVGGISSLRPPHGWSRIIIPDKRTLITDAGKLYVLDSLLKKLKDNGHRVLIYSQMTRMIDLLEEYMFYRNHKYMRLDGSSKIHERRDMVEDFQTRSDIFVFLLSTRAGGLGINLTAADTVIFYDSDWNPTVDQQAMDRAHRLGQTKQVTVYRLICKGTIEERILQRATEKNEIQRMVISGGHFRPDQLKAKEVVSLLLDDDVIERKFRARQAENQGEKRKKNDLGGAGDEKRPRPDGDDLSQLSSSIGSRPPSRNSERSLESSSFVFAESPESSLMVDMDITPLPSPGGPPSSFLDLHMPRRKRGTGRKRGRPRGSTSRGRGRGGHAAPGQPASTDPAGGSGDVAPRPIRRGRGRPRLVPGSGNQGSRQPVRLPVPLASSKYFQEQQQKGGTGSRFSFHSQQGQS